MRQPLRRHLSRAGWLVLIALIGFTVYGESYKFLHDWARLGSKLGLGAAAYLLWRIARRTMFGGYFELEEWIAAVWEGDDLMAKAIVVLGVCVLYAGMCVIALGVMIAI